MAKVKPTTGPSKQNSEGSAEATTQAYLRLQEALAARRAGPHEREVIRAFGGVNRPADFLTQEQIFEKMDTGSRPDRPAKFVRLMQGLQQKIKEIVEAKPSGWAAELERAGKRGAYQWRLTITSTLDGWIPPRFVWRPSGGRMRLGKNERGLDLWLRALSLEAPLHLAFVPTGEWKPPSWFTGYKVHRAGEWQTAIKDIKQQFKGEIEPSDSTVWGVECSSTPGGHCLCLQVHEASYADYIATVPRLGSKVPKCVAMSDVTLKAHWEARTPLNKDMHFLTLPNLLRVGVFIITKDDRAVLALPKAILPTGVSGVSESGESYTWKSERKRSWTAAVNEVANATLDVGYLELTGLKVPNPQRTVTRRVLAEFGLDVSSMRPVWSAVCMSSEKGTVTVIGELEMDLSFEELKSQWEAVKTPRSEVENLTSVRLESSEVKDFLDKHPQEINGSLEAGLAVCLFRRKRAEIRIYDRAYQSYSAPVSAHNRHSSLYFPDANRGPRAHPKVQRVKSSPPAFCKPNRP